LRKTLEDKMEIKDFETYDIYYDKEGDFLEILFGNPPKNESTEEIDHGIFVTKNVETNELRAIGILSFKERCHVLNEILKKLNINFPLNISHIE